MTTGLERPSRKNQDRGTQGCGQVESDQWERLPVWQEGLENRMIMGHEDVR